MNSTITIGFCRDCKWWVARESLGSPRYGHRYCASPKNESEGVDGFGQQGAEPCAEGSFATGPDFGCVHFELRQ